MSDALKVVASGISSGINGGKLAVVASPKLTNENVCCLGLFRDKLKVASLDHRLPVDHAWYGDDLLRSPIRIRTGWVRSGWRPAGEGGIGVEAWRKPSMQGRSIRCGIRCDPGTFLSESALKKLKRIYLIARNASEVLNYRLR